MPDICVQFTPATCGHPQTGSSRVTIEGRGVCRVDTDTAGGLIIGPGSQNVFVEGDKVSIPGDAITSHGKAPHTGPRTLAGQTRVTVGTGFAADPNSTGLAPKPDLQMLTFEADKLDLFASGQGHYPPTNMIGAITTCDPDALGPLGYINPPPPPPTVTYSYAVKNTGQDAAQPFVVGFWRFLNPSTAPDSAILTIAGAEFYGEAELVAEQSVGSLAPGEISTGTFQYDQLYSVAEGTYVFGAYADIYNTTTEPDEQNSINTIRITVSNACG